MQFAADVLREKSISLLKRIPAIEIVRIDDGKGFPDRIFRAKYGMRCPPWLGPFRRHGKISGKTMQVLVYIVDGYLALQLRLEDLLKVIGKVFPDNEHYLC